MKALSPVYSITTTVWFIAGAVAGQVSFWPSVVWAVTWYSKSSLAAGKLASYTARAMCLTRIVFHLPPPSGRNVPDRYNRVAGCYPKGPSQSRRNILFGSCARFSAVGSLETLSGIALKPQTHGRLWRARGHPEIFIGFSILAPFNLRQHADR
jgi:hypothetical protein